jgi:hypothetical protein
VHADVFGNIPEHHGFEVGDALIEKFPLEFQDAFHDLVDGLLALVDAADQPGAERILSWM